MFPVWVGFQWETSFFDNDSSFGRSKNPAKREFPDFGEKNTTVVKSTAHRLEWIIWNECSLPTNFYPCHRHFNKMGSIIIRYRFFLMFKCFNMVVFFLTLPKCKAACMVIRVPWQGWTNPAATSIIWTFPNVWWEWDFEWNVNSLKPPRINRG